MRSYKSNKFTHKKWITHGPLFIQSYRTTSGVRYQQTTVSIVLKHKLAG